MRPLPLRAAPLAALLAACGGGALPDGGATPLGDPVLAPLETGARWTYRITDPLAGVFTKTVDVVGPSAVPESGATAFLVVDTEPTQEERAWMGVRDGYLVRAREEDRKDGVLVRTTTWDPAAPKTLAVLAEVGFSSRIAVTERERHADGSTTTKTQEYAFAVVATDVQVTVPAGTFSCLQLERQRLDKVEPKRTYWLAPGVGKVREESDRVEELVSYAPAP